MIAHSQPIALPASAVPAAGGSSLAQQDYAMHDAGSYSGGDAEGTFNPASFTRHFLGSPISWRASSWGMHNARIPAGSPTAQLLSSIDLNDYRTGKTPSSIESDSIMNALNVFEREGELCRNYTCCGLHLTDLHALLEHFEEVHIVVLDPESAAPQAHIQIPFNPTVHTVPDAQPLPHQALPHHLQSQQQLSQQHPQQRHQQQQQFAQHPQRQQYAQSQPQSQHSQPYATPFDPDDMELDLDLDNTSLSGPPSHPPPPPPSLSSRSSPSSLAPSSAAPSPPDTPISTPLSAYPSSPGYLPMGFSGAQGHYVSGPPSPLGMSAYGSTAPSTAASTRQNSPSPSANSPESNNSSHANMSTNGRPALSALTFPRSLFPAGFPASGFAGPGFSGAGRGGLANGLNNGSTIQPEDAFNAYARFASDYSSCMPGAQFNGATVDEASAWGANGAGQGIGGTVNGEGNEGCVPPALLFAGVGSPGKSGNAKKSQPGGKGAYGARAQAPIQNGQTNQSAANTSNATPQLSTAAAVQSSTAHNTIAAPTPSNASVTATATASPSASLQRPPSSLLMSKPFRCPKPNCNKSYKQANGLKYHMTHGSCNFAPPKDLEHVKDLLERKRREREANGGQQPGGQGSGLVRSTSLGSAPQPMVNGQSHPQTLSHSQTQPGTPLSPTSILSLTPADLAHISESELVEVEREAERRLRPFACGVGECTRRYKNMNGLRYHYQHSGDHGAVGLALLASGVHECLGGKRGQGGHNQTQNQHSQQQQAGAHRLGGGGKGSVSVPVSRAGSVSVATSRVGTPAPHGQNAFMSAYGQQHQSQQQQQHTYALPPMTLGLGLQPLGAATSNTSSTATLTPNTMSNLKTTAITPTTAPPMAVQAQAFVVPQATSQFQAQHSRSSSGASNTSPSRPGSAGIHAQAQSQQASQQSQLNAAQGQYAYPSSVYQHYAQQQQRYGLGLGLGMGVALGTGPSGSANVNVLGANSTLNSPLNPTPAAAPSAAEASPAASSSSSSGNSGSPNANGAEYGGGLFLNAHGEFVASEDALGLGFGQQNAEHGRRQMGQEEQEQDAARAAAMYARQQHQQNAAGVGMEL